MKVIQVIILIYFSLLNTMALDWMVLDTSNSNLSGSNRSLQMDTDENGNVYILEGTRLMRSENTDLQIIYDFQGKVNKFHVKNSDSIFVQIGLEIGILTKGVLTKFDTDNSCFEGDFQWLAGLDKNGSAVIDMRENVKGFEGETESKGIVRFNGEVCSPVELSLPNQYDFIRNYSFIGEAEYFEVWSYNSGLGCNHTIEKTSDEQNIFEFGPNQAGCELEIEQHYGNLFFTSGSGLFYKNQNDSIRHFNLFGSPLYGVMELLVDSKNNLWFSRISHQSEYGLIKISNSDTILFTNDSFDGNNYYALQIEEDGDGNLWMAVENGELVIFNENEIVKTNPDFQKKLKVNRSNSTRDVNGRSTGNKSKYFKLLKHIH